MLKSLPIPGTGIVLIPWFGRPFRIVMFDLTPTGHVENEQFALEFTLLPSGPVWLTLWSQPMPSTVGNISGSLLGNTTHLIGNQVDPVSGVVLYSIAGSPGISIALPLLWWDQAVRLRFFGSDTLVVNVGHVIYDER